MKVVRIAVTIFFAFSLIIYGAGFIKEASGKDPTRPVITSDRDILEISVDYEESDLIEGLLAEDKEDGDLTSGIIVGEFSQFIEKGVCNVTYAVFDSANQAGTYTRKVKFTDYRSPELTLSEPLVLIKGKSEPLLKKIGASDVLDGDISALVKQVKSTVNYTLEGRYTLSVEVTNSLGDVEEQELPVHVVGASDRALNIELTKAIVYLKKGQDFNPDDYVSALESADGNELPLSLVTVDSKVDTKKEGCYEVRYSADNGGLKGETWLTVIVRA